MRPTTKKRRSETIAEVCGLRLKSARALWLTNTLVQPTVRQDETRQNQIREKSTRYDVILELEGVFPDGWTVWNWK